MYLEHQSVITPSDVVVSVITDFGADDEHLDQRPIALKISGPDCETQFVWLSAAQVANLALSLNKSRKLWERITEKLVLGWHYGYGSPFEETTRLVPNPWTDGTVADESCEPECHE